MSQRKIPRAEQLLTFHFGLHRNWLGNLLKLGASCAVIWAAYCFISHRLMGRTETPLEELVGLPHGSVVPDR